MSSNIIVCPECSTQTHKDATKCPSCGYIYIKDFSINQNMLKINLTNVLMYWIVIALFISSIKVFTNFFIGLIILALWVYLNNKPNIRDIKSKLYKQISYVTLAILTIIMFANATNEADNISKDIVLKENHKLINTSNNTESISEKIVLEESSIRIGQEFSTDKFLIKIREYKSTNTVGNGFLSSIPSPGRQFIIIHAAYKNISNRPISSFSLPDIYLIDNNGNRYSEDIGASSSYATEYDTDEKILSDLNPGLQSEKASVFEVSSELFDESSWKILVKADKKVEVLF